MFYDKFSRLCASKGLSNSKVLLELGLSKSNNTAWKTGRNEPSNEMVKAIADYFGVSVDYFLTEDIKKEPDKIDRFKSDYYLLDSEDRETVDTLISTLLSKQKYKKINVG